MAISAIAMPFIRMEGGNNEPCVQKDAVAEAAAQTWLKDTLVYLTSAAGVPVLNKVVSSGILVYGQSPDPSVGTGGVSTPPTKLFGTNHFCFDVRDRIIEINAAAGTAGGAGGTGIGTTAGVTWAGGGTGGVALAAGQQYGIYVPASGTYANYQFLDVQNTGTLLFEVVALAPGQAITDNNPRIWVKVIPTKIQG